MAMATIDFETESIEKRPEYPPLPVGVAIKYKRMKRYMAWGHPTENNCTKTEAKRVLKSIYREADSVLFHNASFDLYVGRDHLGLPIPSKWHDSLLLAYLHDPRDESLALKPLADKYLDMPPDEQTELRDWILTNIPEAKRKPSSWGAYIAKAPGKLVGKYAVGDVVRTEGLFKLFYPIIEEESMIPAYERERLILPIIEEDMSSIGMRVAVRPLKRDILVWEKEILTLDNSVRRRLKCSKDVNLGSNIQLADVMDSAGKIDHWYKTDKGNRSTSMDNLRKGCNDIKLLDMLARKGKLETCLNTFAHPWLATAEVNDGYIFPNFNQTRRSTEYGGSRGNGTKTGRLSSSDPNLQNVPRDMDDDSMAWSKDLPFMRSYLVPDVGCTLLGRDYSQQEIRILGHYEDGELIVQYNANPRMDVHSSLQKRIQDMTGVWWERKPVKETGFGLIYGMGIPALSDRINEDYDTAKALKKAYLNAVPGIKDLNKSLRRLAADEEPLYTWGGRRYYCEEPKMVKGRMRTFEYKMLNLLIQGSAADCTKEAMIRVRQACSNSRITVQVHDELLMNTAKGHEKKEMKLMQEAMESVEFDVPMLSDGKKSAKSWGDMKSWEVK